MSAAEGRAKTECEAGLDGRIERRFAELKAAGRGGLVTFLTAGDPDFESSLAILQGLPKAGADLIEIGMPFSDPMADGPAIQASSQRALKAGMSLERTLELVGRFRAGDQATPLVLMGYYNPIYAMGNARFLSAAREAGVDGLIVVDLPPEEDEELCLPALASGIRWIRLATPTSDELRLPAVLANAGGFLYYVSITGITGTRSAARSEVSAAVARLKKHTALPVAIGFGIRKAEQVAEAVAAAEAAVVGSALVERLRANLDEGGRARSGLVEDVLAFVAELAQGARQGAPGG